MFTGIVTDIGSVLALDQQGDLRARIGTRYDIVGIDVGASIACDGVCLTVIALGQDPQNWFDVQISAESVSKTNIGDWTLGKRLNLERALKVGDELGGHIVTGHVDGVGRIAAIEPEGDSNRVTIAAPHALGPYLAAKGSISLDGISLTVNSVEDKPDAVHVGINIIPHTAQMTTFATLAVGRPVHIEIDILARYLGRMEQLRHVQHS